MSRQNRFILYLIFVLCFSIIFSYKNNPQGFISLSPFHQTAQVSSINQSQAQIFIPAKQTKFSNCQIHGSYPDPECTPGAYIATATKDDICAPGYAKSVRNVSESQKKNIYAEYGITHRTTGEYEIDHFISLELGGSNETSNLFPEAAEPRPGPTRIPTFLA